MSSEVTIPQLPENTTPPNTSLLEISNSGTSQSASIANIVQSGQTPWTQEINAAGNNLINLNELEFTNPGKIIVPAASQLEIIFDATTEYSFTESQADFKTNNLVMDDYTFSTGGGLITAESTVEAFSSFELVNSTNAARLSTFVGEDEVEIIAKLTGSGTSKRLLFIQTVVPASLDDSTNTVFTLDAFRVGGVQNAKLFALLNGGSPVIEVLVDQTTKLFGVLDLNNNDLINAGINAANNTLTNIDETMQIVNTGAVGSILTSNGVGAAPTYQTAGVDGILSINTDTTAAQLIQGFTNQITVNSVSGTTTINVGTNVVLISQANTYTAGAKQSFVADNINAALNLNAQVPISLVAGDIYRTAEVFHFIGTTTVDYILVSNGQPTTYTAGKRQDFLGDIAGTAGLNIGGITASPSTQIDGDIWLNTTTNEILGRVNGANVLLSGGAAVTNEISQGDTSVTVTDGGSDGLINYLIDGVQALAFTDSGAKYANHSVQLALSPTTANISSSQDTLTIDGNLFVYDNTTATFNSIDSDGSVAGTSWQAGAVIYLQFPDANSTGIDLKHDETVAGTQRAFWLLNEVDYTVDSTNFNQILSFIFDGTYWVQQSFGVAGDVVGPSSDVIDRQVAIFDGTTGKLIAEGGQSGFPGPTIDTNGRMTIDRGISFTTNGILAAGEEQIFSQSNSLFLNATTSVQIYIADASQYTFNQTAFILNNNNIQIGTAYYQLESISSPADTGSATIGRIFMDADNSQHLTIQRNNVEVDLESFGDVSQAGGVVAENSIATFTDSFGKTIDEGGRGASLSPTIVPATGFMIIPAVLDFTAFAGGLPSNSNEYIYNNSNTLTLHGNSGVTLRANGNDELQVTTTNVNIPTNNFVVTAGNATLTDGNLIFSDNDQTITGLYQITFNGATQSGANVTAAALNLSDNTNITWEGAADATPNFIKFSQTDVFTLGINDVEVFKISDVLVQLNQTGGMDITNIIGLQFVEGGTSEITGIATDAGIQVALNDGDVFRITENSNTEYDFSDTRVDVFGNDIDNIGTLNYNAPGTALAVTANAIDVIQTVHTVDTSGGAETIDTINNGVEGDILILRTNNANDLDIDETGNIITSGNTGVTLANPEDTIVFIFDGTDWVELSISLNG